MESKNTVWEVERQSQANETINKILEKMDINEMKSEIKSKNII